jgi:hypothetical protein
VLLPVHHRRPVRGRDLRILQIRVLSGFNAKASAETLELHCKAITPLVTGYLRMPKFRGDRQLCLACRPDGRTRGRIVVITALTVTSDLAGRLRPPRGPERAPAGHGAADGNEAGSRSAGGSGNGRSFISGSDRAEAVTWRAAGMPRSSDHAAGAANEGGHKEFGKCSARIQELPR